MNKFILLTIIASLALVQISTAATANTAGVSTVDGNGNVTACQQGYKLVGTVSDAAATCAPCDSGMTSTSANTSTTCTACPQGNYCSVPAATGTTTDTPPNACMPGFYCPASTAEAAGQTACPSGQYSAASAISATDANNGCLPITGTAIIGCQSYIDAAASKCAASLPGYITIAKDSGGLAPTGGSITQCVTGCNACTDGTVTGCSATAPGYYQDNTDPANVVYRACSSDSSCSLCTFSTSTTPTVTCTAAGAGFWLDSTN